MSDDEMTMINVIASHPAMAAIALVQASERNDTETIWKMCEESSNMFAVVSWLTQMVSGAVETRYTLDEYLDRVAEGAIKLIRDNGTRWGTP